jgi:hypothetical protein
MNIKNNKIAGGNHPYRLYVGTLTTVQLKNMAGNTAKTNCMSPGYPTVMGYKHSINTGFFMKGVMTIWTWLRVISKPKVKNL